MQPIAVRDYDVHFEHHDEVGNATSVDIDREVWLLLLCYPLDCRSFATVAKSLRRFALLKLVDEPEVMAQLVVKVVLHDEHQFQPHVVV